MEKRLEQGSPSSLALTTAVVHATAQAHTKSRCLQMRKQDLHQRVLWTQALISPTWAAISQGGQAVRDVTMCVRPLRHQRQNGKSHFSFHFQSKAECESTMFGPFTLL